MQEYTVQGGDCMESIAAEAGFCWEGLWNHPNNAKLRELRQDPNVLLPGDVLYLPERDLRWEDRATDQQHKFVFRGPVCKLVLQLKDFDQPLARQPYVLTVEGMVTTGATDEDGKLEATIPPGACAGTLLVGPPDAQEEYVLKLGCIDPIDELTGIEARLHNLGFRSLAEFQNRLRLKITGEPDAPTLAKLRDAYGC